MLTEVTQQHGGDAKSNFERAIRIWVERRQFWAQFTDVPEIIVDTETIGEVWRTAYEIIIATLQAKQASPLESISFSPEALSAITTYNTHRQEIQELNNRLQATNDAIRLIQEQAIASNPVALRGDVVRLRATKMRYSATTAQLCADYLAEKAAKTATEQLRDQARSALNQYQRTTYPTYNVARGLPAIATFLTPSKLCGKLRSSCIITRGNNNGLQTSDCRRTGSHLSLASRGTQAERDFQASKA